MDEIPAQPPEPANPDPIVRAVKSLTVAVWFMAAGIFLMFGFFAWIYIGPMVRYSSKLVSSSTAGPAAQTSWQPEKFEGKDFNGLTLEKRIKYASVILVTQYVTFGGVRKEVISEIVKVTPGTDFHRKVGDELKFPGSSARRPEDSSEGNVVFMVGSPPDFRESSGYENDQFGFGPNAMSLERLRDLAKGDAKADTRAGGAH